MVEEQDESVRFQASGPPVLGLPVADRNMQLAVEAQGLQRLVPSFYDPDEVSLVCTLEAKDPVPDDVTGVTFTLPEVVEVWFSSYSGAEPAVNFTDIIQGIGCLTFVLLPAEITKVKGLVGALASQVAEGSDPPQINGGFADAVKRCLDAIFNNNEPVSYRRLLAFTIGVFWLLGFVEEPKKKRGRLSPLDFASELVQHFARLAYLPT